MRFNVSGSAISLTASLTEKKNSNINVNSSSCYGATTTNSGTTMILDAIKVRGYLELVSMHRLNRKQHKTNEKCTMRSFMSHSSSTNIGNSIKDDNMGKACGMCIGGEKHVQRFCRET